MLNKNIVLPSIVLLLGLALTACGTSANVAPANTQPALAAPLPSSTNAPAAASTDASVPSSPNTAEAGTTSVSFARDILPIFENTCIKCHGGESTKEGLDLKTYAALMAGSRNGSVVTPGNANDSYLVDTLVKGKMPKRGPKLDPAQIKLIVDWINSGAPNN